MKHVNNEMKQILKDLFFKFGFEIKRVNNSEPFNCLGQSDINALTLHYSLVSTGAVINARLDQARGLPIFSYGPDGNHPFQRAAQKASSASSDDLLSTIRSALDDYYTRFTPETCSELFNLAESPDIANRPPWAMVMPWSARTPDEWQEHVQGTVIRENAEAGLYAGIDSGWAWIGPVKPEKLDVEARRLSKVLESVKSNGYNRHDGGGGDIMAELLANNEGDWVWQSVTGQHRAAVVGALQWEEVPIRFKRIIRRQDVAYWPNVVNGCFSERDALGIFDSIFQGQFENLVKQVGDLRHA